MNISAITQSAISELVAGHDLDYETARNVMNEILTGHANEIQISAFMTSLRMKGETIDEITACAEVMREHADHLTPNFDVMDIVGTGGDGQHTMNISTTAAFILATAGVPVAKHGNRSVSSKCGAADVLEAIGLNIDAPPHIALEWLREFNFCFLFAQKYHSALKSVGIVRKVLALRTIFNILGPLANPAGATLQLMGVYSKELVEPMAKVLFNLGVKRGMVVYGLDGLDEATLCDGTFLCEVCEDGSLSSRTIYPEEFGLTRCTIDQILGEDAKVNAGIVRALLSGKETGPRQEIVALNAGLGLYIAGKAGTIQEGIDLALEIMRSGQADALMEKMIQVTRKFESSYDFE
ncbi:MAG: anthranilate phosphoribosyltransferase [Thermoguttaceae bacterium]|nr:anthranilate phosphoribosyltransferase [Thermoguttaceae bacterium]